MTEAAERRRRADAVRSRAAIVAAATEMFAREGAGISLDRVAKHAGVGSATLYRHFANRRLLLDAVFTSVTAALAARADAEAESTQDADALWRWLDFVVRHCATDRAVVDAAHEAVAPPEEAWAPLLLAGAPLLDRARVGGRVDTRLSMLDILRVLAAVAATASGDPDDASRLFSVVRDGLADGSS